MSDPQPVRTIDPHGVEKWMLDGRIHRLDGPAYIDAYFTDWYRYGLHHRVDGPARIAASGILEWYNDGHLHRVDGPARTFPNGSEEWWVNGQPHRLDGPAICYFGYKAWWVNGEKHRADGPAIIRTDGDGDIEWWVDGKIITREVEQWVEDFEIRDWKEWDDTERVWFRMMFA